MNEAINQMLTSILIALISLAASYAVLYINKLKEKAMVETAKLKDEKHRQLVNDALDQLNRLAAKTITKIEQTAASEIRQAVKDGKTDKEKLKALAVKAYDEIYLTLKPEYRKLLEKELGSFSKYLEDTIEEKVFEIKNLGMCSYL